MAKLSVWNICAYYGNKQVLKNVSVSIETGKLTCLCGPNGSGKSTLLNILSGSKEPHLNVLGGINRKTENLKPDEINAMELKKLPRIKAAQIVSFMQQAEFSTWDFSVKELVLQGRYCHTKNGTYTLADEQIAMQALEELEIVNLADRTVHSLSGGEFQKTRIARALCQQSQFILLDEPSSNLDFVYEPYLLQKLKNIAHSKNIGIWI